MRTRSRAATAAGAVPTVCARMRGTRSAGAAGGWSRAKRRSMSSGGVLSTPLIVVHSSFILPILCSHILRSSRGRAAGSFTFLLHLLAHPLPQREAQHRLRALEERLRAVLRYAERL